MMIDAKGIQICDGTIYLTWRLQTERQGDSSIPDLSNSLRGYNKS